MNITILVDHERTQADPRRLDQMFERVARAGHPVTRIMPASAGARTIEIEDDPELKPEWVTAQYRVPMTGPPWTQRLVAGRLEHFLLTHDIEVIWAVGVDGWGLARRLSRRLHCPLAVSIWCPAVARRVARLRRSTISSYIVPTRAMADWLRERVDEDLVSLVPPGVEDVPASPPRPLLRTGSDRPICLGILGRGRDASAYSAMLGGLRQAITEYPNVRLFIELRGRADHEIWRHLLRLDLLERTSTFPSVVSVHTLVAQCDALLFPERYGEIHSIMLESMRDGVPLVASADPALAGIIDESTAAIVEQPTVEQWSQQLRRLLGHPDEAADRAAVAAQRVRTAFRRERQIEILLETFERMLHGEAYSFGGANSAGLSDETRPT